MRQTVHPVFLKLEADGSRERAGVGHKRRLHGRVNPSRFRIHWAAHVWTSSGLRDRLDIFVYAKFCG